MRCRVASAAPFEDRAGSRRFLRILGRGRRGGLSPHGNNRDVDRGAPTQFLPVMIDMAFACLDTSRMRRTKAKIKI
jgi:hypothetical protein